MVEVLLGHGRLLGGGVAHSHPAKASQIGELHVLTVHPKHSFELRLCVWVQEQEMYSRPDFDCENLIMSLF